MSIDSQVSPLRRPVAATSLLHPSLPSAIAVRTTPGTRVDGYRAGRRRAGMVTVSAVSTVSGWVVTVQEKKMTFTTSMPLAPVGSA